MDKSRPRALERSRIGLSLDGVYGVMRLVFDRKRDNTEIGIFVTNLTWIGCTEQAFICL